MSLSYGIEKIFNEDIPNLQHGNDGLIYTCLQSPYVVGTDPKMHVFSPPQFVKLINFFVSLTERSGSLRRTTRLTLSSSSAFLRTQRDQDIPIYWQSLYSGFMYSRVAEIDTQVAGINTKHSTKCTSMTTSGKGQFFEQWSAVANFIIIVPCLF